MARPEALFNFNHVYVQNGATRYPEGRLLLAKALALGCKVQHVQSHWKIPQLNLEPSSVDAWTKVKRERLVIGIKGRMHCRENGRSTDYVAPSHSNGCVAACNYCYVARRKGYANPITVFVNGNEAVDFTSRHAYGLGPKTFSNQCDSNYWIYDIGENNDCSVDAMLSSNVKQYVDMFREHPYAKGSFATKFVNSDLLNYDPQRKMRIRFSLMPPSTSRLLEIRTDPIEERLSAIKDFYDAGWEVHLNLSPVVVYPGWTKDTNRLFDQINEAVPESIRKDVQAEVIFLTHNQELHNLNMRWHPKGERLIWSPDLQETKISQTGGKNLRYRWQMKQKMIQHYDSLLQTKLPWLNIRYMF